MDQKVQQDVKQFWTARAGFWDTMYETDSPFWRWFNRKFRKGIFVRAEVAVKTSVENKAQSVLDVGCGTGRISCLLAQAGVPRVVGVDTAAPMVELAKQLARASGLADKCEFVAGDFRSTDVSGKFDGVIALGVFDYLDEPLPFLQRMRELASRFVVASFPAPTLVRSPLRRIRYALRGCPVYFYRLGRIQQLFKDAGLARIDVVKVGGGHVIVGWL